LFIGWGIFAVLSSARIGIGSWRYYQNSVVSAACEYYLGVGEKPGGRGAAAWTSSA
jgi:hypothetical protein